MKTEHWIRAMLAICGVASLGGCAGIVRPLVTEPLNVACSAPAGGSDAMRASACEAHRQCKTKHDETQCDALALAEIYRAKYLQAATNRANLAGTANLIAIGSGLAGLNYTLDGRQQYRDRIRRLGVIGVGSYAVSSAYAQSPLTLTYLNGAAAMECAVYVMAPNFARSQDVSGADAKVDPLRAAIDGFRDALQAFGTAASADDLQLLSDAENTLAGLRGRIHDHKTAGTRARLRLHQIAGEVNRQIVAGQPDPNSILSLVRGFRPMAESLGVKAVAAAAATKPVEPTTEKANGSTVYKIQGISETFTTEGQAVQADTARRNKLDSARTELVSAQRAAAAALEHLSPPNLEQDELAACSPNAERSKFEVTPADRSIVLTKDKSYSFTIVDHGGVPFARAEGKQATSITLNPVEAIGDRTYRLTIVGKEPITADGTRVLIRSSNGWQVVEVAVKVKN